MFKTDKAKSFEEIRTMLHCYGLAKEGESTVTTIGKIFAEAKRMRENTGKCVQDPKAERFTMERHMVKQIRIALAHDQSPVIIRVPSAYRSTLFPNDMRDPSNVRPGAVMTHYPRYEFDGIPISFENHYRTIKLETAEGNVFE